MSEQAGERNAARDDSTQQDLNRHSPFQDEASVMVDPAAQTDEISRVQTDAEGAAHESGEHLERLLYQPGYGYVYDPRSSPGGVEYYPGPVSGTGEQQK